MKLYATILALCFLGLGWSTTALECQNETVQFCLDFLSRDGLDVGHIDDDLPTWNETVKALHHRCSSFDQFTDCMSGVTEHCTSHKYQGWIDAYEYLCKKSNLTLVVDYLKCYSSPTVVNATEIRCKRVFEFKANTILNGSTTIPSDKMDDYCQVADGFFACLNKTLTSNCGEEAAKWQWNWDRALSMPFLRQCPGWSTDEDEDDGSPSSWTIALIVVLVLITSIMIIAIVFLLVFLFKKRKLRTRSQEVRRRAQAALPPPPYSAVMFTSPEPGGEPQAHLVDSSVTLRPGDLGAGDAPAASSDVVLPPPYMGDRPPVPEYESLDRPPVPEYESLDRPPVPEYESLQKDDGQESPVQLIESLQKDIQEVSKEEGTVETSQGHSEANIDVTNSANKRPDE